MPEDKDGRLEKNAGGVKPTAEAFAVRKTFGVNVEVNRRNPRPRMLDYRRNFAGF